jgi:hypothetical protein
LLLADERITNFHFEWDVKGAVEARDGEEGSFSYFVLAHICTRSHACHAQNIHALLLILFPYAAETNDRSECHNSRTKMDLFFKEFDIQDPSK